MSASDKADLLLHPVRMKIILCLAGGKSLSVLQIAERLPEVAQATLYRHMKKLSDGGVIYVASENQVRGTVEKIYALAEQGGSLTPDDIAKASNEDHMRFFLMFLASLLNEFGQYLENGGGDLVRDGVTFRQAAMFLSDEEFEELRKILADLVIKGMANEPAPGRRRRTMANIFIPHEGAAKTSHNEGESKDE